MGHKIGYFSGKRSCWFIQIAGFGLAIGLTACGGNTISTGTSTTSVPGPTITSINPSSATAGGGASTISITGSNFTSADVVNWNGSAVQSSYTDSTTISAVVPASDLATVGTNKVTVSDAEGSTSNAETFTVASAPPAKTTVRTMNLFPNDIVWDSALGKLLLTFPSTDTTNPNTVATVDPVAMSLGSPVAAGNDPNRMAISSDGSYLWVGLEGDDTVQRFLLPSLSKDIAFPVPGPVSNDPLGNQQAICLQAAPVSAHTLAIVAGDEGDSPAGESVYVYDDAVQKIGHTNCLTCRTGVHNEIRFVNHVFQVAA